MTSDEKAMLSAIIADPANDTPRLIYADWLEEQGDSNRAEFIRDTVWIHANHTDCPTRLADLGSGRPVPLRCGICEYCTRRRCAEKFNSKHHWIDAPAYAVFFEPTPLDGEIPATYGIALVIRRGFVAEVHCTLADWISHGPAIVAAQPVEVVRVTDMRILPSGGNDTYYVDGLGRLPQQYWSQLEGLPSRGAAIAALSAALIAFAKAQRKEQA